MINDQTLTKAIQKSPLSEKDKQHWLTLLPKLNSEQKERLLHSLTAKTEISSAIKLIEKALNIIAEAEEEAEAEVKEEEKSKRERKELLQELDEIKKKEDKILLDEEQLKQKQNETNAQIKKIRQELHTLSMEVHGSPPPSYNQQLPQPLPQLKSK